MLCEFGAAWARKRQGQGILKGFVEFWRAHFVASDVGLDWSRRFWGKAFRDMDGLDIRSAEGEQPLDITFDSRGDKLIGLSLFNALMRLVTLGIYSFWAKTDVRRRLWSFTKINGEPLEYTGTGKELFLGFLIVSAFFFLPVLLIGVAVALLAPDSKTAAFIYQGAVYVVFLLLIGNATYRAQRYRMSRTRWRGIRGALVGSPARYGWTYFWTLALPFLLVAVLAFATAKLAGPEVGGGIVLAGLAAGLWILPWRSNKLQADMTNDMHFGDRPLTYTGVAGPLYRRYLYAWLGSALVYIGAAGATAVQILRSGTIERWQAAKIPLTLTEGLALVITWLVALFVVAVLTAWYRASQYRHFAEHTHFEGASFRSEVTGPGLMWLVISNWLLSGLSILLGFLIGTGLLIALDVVPSQPTAPAQEPQLLAAALVIGPIVLLTSVAATFAQFRWVRYFTSRLKLIGPVNLERISQGQDQGIKRGEGLAQVFDLDAF
jgi:uncharacterized membrane protein YjgN (DUF898 family)